MDTTTPLQPNKPLPTSNPVATVKTVETKTPLRVVESDAVAPLPGVSRPLVTLNMEKHKDTELDIDKDTVVYLMYLLYKTNMLARNNLRNMIDEIGKPLPNDVLKWLVNEAAKVGR